MTMISILLGTVPVNDDQTAEHSAGNLALHRVTLDAARSSKHSCTGCESAPPSRKYTTGSASDMCGGDHRHNKSRSSLMLVHTGCVKRLPRSCHG